MKVEERSEVYQGSKGVELMEAEEGYQRLGQWPFAGAER
jgi:hypothetical protein